MIKELTALLTLSISLGVSAQQTTPPWSGGRNDPAPSQGFVFQVPDIDNVPDLHGDPIDAKLVLFIGGNQFFVMPRLIAGFEKLHPELAGHIFYETLPPGVLLKQIKAGNTLTLGNLTLDIVPDVYEAGANALRSMKQTGEVGEVVSYTTNDLEIMVAAGNPKHIASLKDLARPDVRVALPNPEFEGIGRQVQVALTKTGGDALATEVYKTRVGQGGVVLTQIHHRQTPMRILTKQSDAGVTWTSEVLFQQKLGNPIEGVEIPSQLNTPATYAAGVLKSAPHPEAARAWIHYLQSDEAQAAYREFGFKPVAAESANQ
ncbi:MAG TPA: substrate-binding domain-containing protein [Acidobacteriaceae bacterium]|nr:substrate-binding domain-containing protein [Acidobacteriaceae bacterium]